MMFFKTENNKRGGQRKRSKGRVIEIGLPCLFLSVIIWALLLVGLRIQSIEFRYRIGKARQEHKELKQIQDRLRLEAAVLRSPARIVEIATKELGMEKPTMEQLIVIR
jgi:cell division protein FtsL